jgi:hypothetical protein
LKPKIKRFVTVIAGCFSSLSFIIVDVLRVIRPRSNRLDIKTWNAWQKQEIHSEISGSHGSEYENDCLLGCCAV